MHPIQQLSNNILKYNHLGITKLSNIKLSIIYKHTHHSIINNIIAHFSCLDNQNIHTLMGLKGYSILKSQRIKGLQLHLINSLEQDEVIQDEDFLKKKKVLQKLSENKDTMICYLQAELQKQLQLKSRPEIMQLKRIDNSINKHIVWKGSLQVFDRQIIKIWQSINRYEIISLLKKLKNMMKTTSKDLERQSRWLSIYQGKAEAQVYAFQMINRCREYIVSSLQGYYSPQASKFNNYYSIHWQIMDIFEDLWREQSETINKELEKMPLSYINDTLKMNDYNTLGGFLPEACFLQIFKPILDRFADSVLVCLEAAKYKVIQNTQSIYEYYFAKTTIKESLLELQLQRIEDICNAFLKQVQNAISSQISYVYAPAESFWEIRNIRSNLYSEAQQANIQVKYIGKVYVKRVFESIRQSIPRFIGHGLLRKVSKYIKQNALSNFLLLTKEIDFAIVLSQSEISQISNNNIKMKDYNQLSNYFSLKVSSTFKIKNLLEKTQLRWRQMYKNAEEQTVIQKRRQQESESGFRFWLKRVFNMNKKEKVDRQKKRSRSNDKWTVIDENSSVIKQQQQNIIRQPHENQKISQKTWILLLNTNKKVDDGKLVIASCYGFPEKLRPSIWYWLSKRYSQKEIKISELLMKQKLSADIVKQIEKDLGRTPPKELFVKKLRSNLRDVLQAYSLLDAQIQYTQGMNFLVAVVMSTLIHWGVKDDYLSQSSQKISSKQINQKALTLLIFLMQRQGFIQVMRIQREFLAQICDRIDVKIKQNNQKVWDIIQKSGFNCQIIFGPLLISGLLTWSSNMEINRRIMDLIICRGFSILYKVVALVACMSEQQLNPLRNEQIYDYLRNKSLDVFFQRVGHSGLSQLFLEL